MKKIKLSTKAVLSLGLSAVLFCMPAVGFALNGNYAVNVHAEDSKEQEAVSEEPAESTGQTEADTEQSAEGGTEESTENTTEESTENGTVSGNEVTEPVCTCEKKCSAYDYDKDCEVCAADYRDCEYKTPNVVININSPGGWYNERATVTFTVSDTAHTGNFEIAMIQAKVGQNGSWTDVTEDKKLEISENCTVYVQVTDQKGNTYERNRAMKCFDTTKPTLNAAVSDGLLSIQVHDTDSGAKAVYVNGYEFTDLTNGTLNIRLQQFDAGYEYFTISAMDNAGNMSEVYKTKGFEVIRAWGFTYKTVAFVWVKQNKKSDSLFWGMGYWTRSNVELCILATKGSPKRVDAGVHQVVVSHIEEHSRKPGEVHERIRRLMGDVPKIELFARRKAEGFDVWGNEVDSDIEFKGGNRLCS